MKIKAVSFFQALVYPLIYLVMQTVVAVIAAMGFALFSVLPAMLADLNRANQNSVPGTGIPALSYEDVLRDNMLDKIQQFAFDSLFGVILVSALLSLVVYLLIQKAQGKPFFGEIGRIKASPLALILSFGAGAMFNVFLSVMIAALDSFWHFTDYLPIDETLNEALGSVNIIIPVLVIGIVVPIVEEITFRAFAFHRLKEGFTITTAIIIQGIIFGLAHIYPLQIVYAGLVGVFFGIAYVKTRSFGVAALMHIGFNVTACLLSLIPDSGEISPLTLGVALLLGVAAVFAYVFIVRFSRDVRLKNSEQIEDIVENG